MPFTFRKMPLPEGRYEVRQLFINQKDMSDIACRDSVLTTVYLEHDVVFGFKHPGKRMIGLYTYDTNTRQMKAIWHFPRNRKDTLIATVSEGENKLIH